MVKKYVYGTPIETSAVIENFEVSENPIKYLTETYENNSIIFKYKMSDNDIVYGLGEANRGINKRGYIYESFCTDDPNHTEEKRSLYGAHNFIVISGKINIGIFADCASKVTFDIDYSERNMLKIIPSENNFIIYIIDGNSAYDIVKRFRKMIGHSYIAPRWAFGYQQSRWSYMNEDEIRNVVRKHKENNLPLDAVYLDIDYMEKYKDFTVSNERFPDFKKFVEKMRSQGIRLVPIIDAGVKIEDGYDVYEEGVKNNYFCKRKDGSDFVSGVWPGRTHFPDFLNKDARRWFGLKYKVLLDDGIEGFWNDMNEPAMFYSDEGIKDAIEYIKNVDLSNPDSNTFFKFKDKVTGLSNRMEDYCGFYHNINGISVRHDKVHNLFGYNMTRSASEAFDELEPDKRILMFSRSSYIGMHRYGGIWTGDNQSWWSHILLNIKMMPSLNMCGFLYIGADLGGFGSNCTEDLLLRWLAFGIFTPLMRNHSALGTRKQECYSFGGNTETFKNILSIRYSLIPYLYSEYMKACLNDDMMIKPLAFLYPNDDFANTVEDQLMIGESIMIAPVYQQNAVGRYVYLPEDMLLVTFKSSKQKTCRLMKKGSHFINVSLKEVPIFIRKNKLLPLCKAANCTDNMDTSRFEIISYATENIEYLMYEDDGISKNYNNTDNYVTFSIKENDGQFNVISSKEIFNFSNFN